MTVIAAPDWDEIVIDSDGPVTKVFTVTGEEFLDTFAQIMHEWGFACSATPKCEPVRLPTLDEARAALARSRYATG